MNPKKEQGEKCVSAILHDGRLVELILGEQGGATRFAVGCGQEVDLVASVLLPSGGRLVPLPASHALVKHQVVRLPGQPIEYGTRDELINELRAYIARYVTLSPTFLSLSAHYVLLSWVYDVFAEVPYLRFKGDFGSGKTRALQVIGSVSYKAIFASGASTVSPIFHALDLFRGTLVFDEADFRFSDERAEVTKIFNSGTSRGFPVLRSSLSDKKDFDPRAFEVFGPKIIGMREVFEDAALESRFFTEVMTGEFASEVPINLPAIQEQEAASLRSKLLRFRLRERSTISLDSDSVDAALSPRGNQLLAPLLSLISDESLRQEIRQQLKEQEEEQAADRGNQVEAFVLDAILFLHAGQPTHTHFSLSEIRAATIKRHTGEFDRSLTSRYLGSLIRNKLGLKSYKSGVYMVQVPTADQEVRLLRKFGLRPTQ